MQRAGLWEQDLCHPGVLVGYYGSRCSDSPIDAWIGYEWESGLLILSYQVTSSPPFGSVTIQMSCWCCLAAELAWIVPMPGG